MNLVLQTLKDIYTLLDELKSIAHSSRQLKDQPLLNKFEVMSRLRISDATYRRYVDKGLLNPMTRAGIDMYYEEDLRKAP